MFTAASKKIELFVNGASVGSGTGAAGSIYDGNASTYIGTQGNTSRYFDGKIDDVRIFNTARSGAAITSDYNKELVGNESGLVAYWRLNNAATDATANANTLTLVNTPTYSTDIPFSTAPDQPAHLGIQNIVLTYDAVGNILNITDTSATVNAHATDYTYDSLYRLTSAATSFASSTPFSEIYTYDSLGNITFTTGFGSYMYQGTTTGSYANLSDNTKSDAAIRC